MFGRRVVTIKEFFWRQISKYFRLRKQKRCDPLVSKHYQSKSENRGNSFKRDKMISSYAFYNQNFLIFLKHIFFNCSTSLIQTTSSFKPSRAKCAILDIFYCEKRGRFSGVVVNEFSGVRIRTPPKFLFLTRATNLKLEHPRFECREKVFDILISSIVHRPSSIVYRLLQRIYRLGFSPHALVYT